MATIVGVLPPDAMIESLNRVLCETGNARSFFAGVYALLEPGGDVTAIVAGHPPVLKVDADGRTVRQEYRGTLDGDMITGTVRMDDTAGERPWRATRIARGTIDSPNYDVMPDGRFVMIQRPVQRSGSELQVLLNWSRNLGTASPR